MEEKDIKNYFDDLNKKLDFIVQEIELQKKHRQEMQDFKEDLMRVGKDVYDSAVYELEEVHDYIKTGDIYFLFKKLLRNINNLTRLFEQIENIRDFIQDFAPVSKELFIDVMNKLDELDRKGFFVFIKDLSKLFNIILENYSKEDIKILSENITLITDIFKKLTQEETLNAVNNLLESLSESKTYPEGKLTYLKIFKEMNNQEVKKVLFTVLKILKKFSELQEKK